MNKRIKKKHEQQQVKLISKNLKKKYNVKGIETPKYAQFDINNTQITIYANCSSLNELSNKLVVKFNTVDSEYAITNINKNTLSFIFSLLGEDFEYHLGKSIKGQTLSDEDAFTKKQYIKEGQKRVKEIEKNNAKIEKNISKLVEKLKGSKNIVSVKLTRLNNSTDIVVSLEKDLKESTREKLVERVLNNGSKVKETLAEIHNINLIIFK